MTGEVVAAVLWGLSAPVGFWLLASLASLVGLFATDPNREYRVVPVFVGILLGWLLGAAWFVLAIVQAILHIVAAVQLA